MTLMTLIATLFAGEPTTCKSTMFGYPGDKWVGGKALYLKRRVNQRDVGVAHRTLPLGSYVLIHNPKTRKFVVAQVIDRGPYGAIYKGRWFVKKRRSQPGRYRGCLDITPAAGKAIGHTGLQYVTFWPIRNPQRLRQSDVWSLTQ